VWDRLTLERELEQLGVREFEAGVQGRVRRRAAPRPGVRALTITLAFIFGLKERLGGRELGSYKFWLVDDKSKTVVAQDRWARIPPDMSTTANYGSFTPKRLFRSSASRFLIQMRVFPIHYQTASEAQMENAMRGDSIRLHLPRGYRGEIRVGVIIWHRTETFRVPAGQTLRNVLAQNQINVYHVARALPTESPFGGVIANSYDVTHVHRVEAYQDVPPVASQGKP
jgi:hypothetical protein